MKKYTPSEIAPPHCAHCLLWAMDDEDDELSTIQLDQKISPGILPSRWTPTQPQSVESSDSFRVLNKVCTIVNT